jgi:hypothetical protein
MKKKVNMNRLQIYDTLRGFHKEALFNMLDDRLTEWERNALEALSGVLYLCEGVFCKQK